MSEAIVCTGNPLAARAGCEMLRQGGSAVDAAIAADAVMGVVEPMATSIGGDLLAMICEPHAPVLAYNGTGRSPQGLQVALVEALEGRRIPQRSPLSVTTPGAVRGWWDLHQRYGRLPWHALLQPAIDHARHGFPVARVAAKEWHYFDHVLHRQPYCASLYRAGRNPVAGERFINPDLARALQRIANQGPEGFYAGTTAHAMVDSVQAAGGVLALEDLSAHHGEFVAPASAEIGRYVVHECPPNTHGVAVLDALRAIAPVAGEKETPQMWPDIVRATGNALARAAQTVEDPSCNTVCTVVVDAQGFAITLMSSVFKRFGSGIAAQDCGFCLQNRGFGFSAPGAVNGAGPGRRPYHTVIPSITTHDGEFFMGLGVVGGLMQPQGQVQILTRVLHWNEELQQALDRPRWRLEPDDSLGIEAGFDAHAAALLREIHPEPHPAIGELAGRQDFGGAHAILRRADGTLVAAADPRKDGGWLRWPETAVAYKT